jgi:hypothetical protein
MLFVTEWLRTKSRRRPRFCGCPPDCGLHTLIYTFALEIPLQYFGASLENAEFLAPLSFVGFLLAIISPSYRSRTRNFKIAVLNAESGTALALLLTQCNICHLAAPKSMHFTPWLHMTVC